MKIRPRNTILKGLALIPLPAGVWRQSFRFLLALMVDRKTEKALKILLESETDLNRAINYTATRYEGGIHPKHRLMHYHDFFVERIEPGELVLDIGCGYGAVAYSIAKRANAVVKGIDNNPENISIARKRYCHPNLTFDLADVKDWIPDQYYKTIIMSNVLEHLEDRVKLLIELQKRICPRQWLFRVPLLNRDWKIPMRRELGLFCYSDETHFTEYTEESFSREMTEAGLYIRSMKIAWGEIWSEVIAKEDL